MLAQGGKVRDSNPYIWRNISEVSLRIPHQKRPGAWKYHSFWDEHMFTTTVHRFFFRVPTATAQFPEAKECLAAAQTQKKSVEEILAASKDWDLDLMHLDAKEPWLWVKIGERETDGTTDFSSICSIILLAKDWGIQF